MGSIPISSSTSTAVLSNSLDHPSAFARAATLTAAFGASRSALGQLNHRTIPPDQPGTCLSKDHEDG